MEMVKPLGRTEVIMSIYQRRPHFAKAYSFAIVTGLLFLASWLAQFLTQMQVARDEASQHDQLFLWSDYLPQFFASTFENWQSEFLQLIWQAAGLAFFYFWGSSQSRESDERLEAKIDTLLRERGVDPRQVNQDPVEEVLVAPAQSG